MIKGYFRVSLFLFLLYNICDVVVMELKMPKYELRDYIEFKMKDDNIYRGNVFAIDQDHLGFFYDVTSIIDDEKVIIKDVREENVIRKYVETVLCYIERNNKYLMLLRNKRKNDLNEGKWLGIGGHIEYNEEPDDALIREVKEETGIRLLDYTKRGLIYFIDVDYTELMHLYTSNEFEGFITPSDEGSLSWIDKDRIFDLNLWDGDRVFLKEMMEDDSYFEMELYYQKNIFKGSKKL